MAVGSNSLALLFKVGVDAGDAQKVFQQLMATNSEFRKGVEEGMKAEAQAFAGVKSSLQGASESAKQASISFNDVRIAIGRLVGGLTLVRAFREISEAIGEIGTRSKDDFDTLQKQVESAGGHITELQRNISQELLGAFDKVKGASVGFMAEVIETSGPALIQLLKDIAKWLGDLKPIAKAIGDDIADTFNRINAMGRAIIELRQRQAAQQPGIGETILEGIIPGLAFKRAMDDMNTFDEAYARHLKNVTDETKKFVAKPAGDDGGGGSIKKARKDLTDAALEQAEAENALSLVRQQAAIADKEINQDQAKGLITQEEGARRRLAVLDEVVKAEQKVFDARRKAIDSDPTLLANQRAKLLDDLQTDQLALTTRVGDAQEEEARKTIAANQKLHDAFAAHFKKLKEEWVTYAEFIHDQTDAIVADLARQAQAVPGGAGKGPIPGAPPEIPLPTGVPTFFEDLQKSLEGSISTFTTWGDLVGKVLGQFAQATETAFAAFILTGKMSGQIFKQLVAQIVASLAIESTIKAIFEYAEAAAAFAVGDIPGGIKHTAAAQIYTAVAVAAGVAGLAIGAAGGLGGGAAAGAEGGGFGGSTEAPGTVTINQGGGAALGIQLRILDALSNITTAPPGDILQRGADQNPMAVGQANNEAARRDGSVSREFLQISGLRTA